MEDNMEIIQLKMEDKVVRDKNNCIYINDCVTLNLKYYDVRHPDIETQRLIDEIAKGIDSQKQRMSSGGTIQHNRSEEDTMSKTSIKKSNRTHNKKDKKWRNNLDELIVPASTYDALSSAHKTRDKKRREDYKKDGSKY